MNKNPLVSISYKDVFLGNWCRKEDLNLRPIAYEATALPTELFRQYEQLYQYAVLARE